MSWEAWGNGEDGGIEPDELLEWGWESDESGEKWWREYEPETVYTLQEATRITEDWLRSEDE